MTEIMVFMVCAAEIIVGFPAVIIMLEKVLRWATTGD